MGQRAGRVMRVWQEVGPGEAESRCLAWVARCLAVPSQSPLRPGLASGMRGDVHWGLRPPSQEGPRRLSRLPALTLCEGLALGCGAVSR